MIQLMSAIWYLVPLPFLNPGCASGSSWFMYCWRILSVTLLACEKSALVQQFNHSLALPFTDWLTQRALFCLLPSTEWIHTAHCCWHCPRPFVNLGNASKQPCSSWVVFVKTPVQIHWSQIPGLWWSCTWTCHGRYGGSSELGPAQAPNVPAHKAHSC